LCQLDISPGNQSAVLAEDVEQHEKIARAPVKNPKEWATAVTSQLAKTGVDLRGLRERKRGSVVWATIHFIDLFFDEQP
jgi:hypothetical protein